MEVLDEDARIFLFHNFLTPEECDHMIALASPSLERSGVVADAEGNSAISEVRTSKGMFLSRGQDQMIRDIERRVARWTLLPVANGEGFQILRYTSGQHYDGHYDYFFDKNSAGNGGNRFATVLIYLNDVEEGGETVFPNIPAAGGSNGPEFSECARHHLAAKPKKGNAVLFHSITTTGELERRSLHTACPVLKGEKWSAPKWIHQERYAVGGERPVKSTQEEKKGGAQGPNGCADNDALCAVWAADGECDKNPDFMVGTKMRPGSCLLSCKRCELLEGTGGREKYV